MHFRKSRAFRNGRRAPSGLGALVLVLGIGFVSAAVSASFLQSTQLTRRERRLSNTSRVGHHGIESSLVLLETLLSTYTIYERTYRDRPDIEWKLKDGATMATAGFSAWEFNPASAQPVLLKHGCNPQYFSVADWMTPAGLSATSCNDVIKKTPLDTELTFLETDNRYADEIFLLSVRAAAKLYAEKKDADLRGYTSDARIQLPPPLPWCELSAAPSTLVLGESTELTLVTGPSVTDAKWPDGTAAPKEGGKVTITPTTVGNDQVLVATVQGIGGLSESCSTTITVTAPAPTCTLSVNGASLMVGQTLSASLSTTWAETAAINGQPATVPTGAFSLPLTVAGSFSLTATVSGPGGSGSCSALYTVAPPPALPSCELVASPAELKVNEQVTLTIATKNATSAMILGQPVEVPSGSYPLSHTVPGEYTASAAVTGAGGAAECTAKYKVIAEPPPTPVTCTLTASAAEVTEGETITFTLSAPQAATATIEGAAVEVPSGSHAMKAEVVGDDLIATATVTDAASATGICSVRYKVKAKVIPPKCTLAASPARLTLGLPVTLVLTSEYATEATIEGMAADVPDGSVTVTPAATGTFTATAKVKGPHGNVECQASYEVVPPTALPSCTLSATPDKVNLNGTVKLAVTMQNATDATMDDGKVLVLPSDSFDVKGDKAGTFTVTATVNGAGGSSTCQATYTVTNICRFALGKYDIFRAPWGNIKIGTKHGIFPGPLPAPCKQQVLTTKGNSLIWNMNAPCPAGVVCGINWAAYGCSSGGANKNAGFGVYKSGSAACYPKVHILRDEGCFAPGTAILMFDGTMKPVEEIAAGELVLSPVTLKAARVGKVVSGPEKPRLYEIGYDDRRVRITRTHPVWTSRGVKQARQLRLGDEIMGSDRRFHRLTHLKLLPRDPNQMVYNIQLEGSDDWPESHLVISDGIVTGDLALQQRHEKNLTKEVP